MTKYFLYFRKDLFESAKSVCISSGFRRNWILTEGANPSWDYLSLLSFKDKREIEINESLFNSLMSLNQMNRYYINKCSTPIELFTKWNLMDDIVEYLI